jgi:hypothetical protein
MITQASPAVWKKFSPAEKKEWKIMYKQMCWELKELLKGPAFKQDKIAPKNIETIAHNFACAHIWAVQSLYLIPKP